MSKGVLDAGTLAELTHMAFEQREKQTARLLELQEEQRVLKADLDLLARKLAQLTAGSSLTVREAVLLVRSDRAGEATLRLSYLVKQAGWDPFYLYDPAVHQARTYYYLIGSAPQVSVSSDPSGDKV